MASIIRLEDRYDREYTGKRLEYAQPEVINTLLNYLKALEYHYRDDVRSKKNPEHAAAIRLLRKLAEPVNPESHYSDYRLKAALTKV